MWTEISKIISGTQKNDWSIKILCEDNVHDLISVLASCYLLPLSIKKFAGPQIFYAKRKIKIYSPGTYKILNITFGYRQTRIFN